MLNLFSGKDEARVISADSMQVYRGMDIGTAKPTPAEQKLLPHYLIDIKNPDEQYSVAEFMDRADSLCQSIHAEGKLPIVCENRITITSTRDMSPTTRLSEAKESRNPRALTALPVSTAPSG